MTNQEFADWLYSQVQYMPCDCGCPMKRKPANRKDVDYLRLRCKFVTDFDVEKPPYQRDLEE